MPLFEIEFPMAGSGIQATEDVLLDLGAISITFQDRGDEPVLEPGVGEIRLWSDTLVRALFDESSDPVRNLGTLADRLGPGITAQARVRPVPERLWEREWLKGWTSLRFGERLWICPVDAEGPHDPRAVVVRLDPGLAFGTGTHPTTAMCLEALDALTLVGRRVIDYGCGSGVLAISALKLGAARAVAIDIDPQALLAARDNAERNGVSAALVTQGVDAETAPADCVLANILAQPLIELAPRFAALCKSRGDLILSGVLAAQRDSVIAAYHDRFTIVQTVERDDWCCIHARGAV